MEYRLLGRTGLKVSELCFGTQTFGWVTEEDSAHSMLDRFVERGGNFFDTADSYNDGESEEILGSWLKNQDRSKYVIGTKVFFETGDGPNEKGLSRKHIMDSVHRSLRRLNTDYIDLYQMHCWDRLTPFEETLRTLDDLISSGKVRYIGASNFTPSQLQKAISTSKINGWEGFKNLQMEYSLLVRSPEWELLPLCRNEGIGVTCWSPLAGGWLTGKYQREEDAPEDSRVGRGDRWDDQPEQRASERTWDIIDALNELSEETGRSQAQISLNWLLQRDGVTAPIFGARTMEQLEDNLGAVDFELDDEQLGRLKKASAIGTPSPYSFVNRYTREHPRSGS